MRITATILGLLLASSVHAGLPEDARISAAVDAAPLVRRSGPVEVRCPRGTLTPRDAQAFAALTARGAAEIARFTGLDEPRRIVVYVSPDVGISHTYPRYPDDALHEPRMFVDALRVKGRSAPYLHELVHAIAGDGGSMWIEEGFASWVAASVARRGGGYYAAVLSGPNDVVDHEAAAVLSEATPAQRQRLLAMLRTAQPPPFRDDDERQDFYVLAHSFTKFLASRLGTAELVAVHERDRRGALRMVTGRTPQQWEEEWVRTLERR